MEAAERSPGAGFGGRTIVAFESRRAVEMAELIRNFGGEPLVAPSMREVQLDDDPHAGDFLRRLEAGGIDMTIFLTGVGLRALIAALPGDDAATRLMAALDRCTVVVRGPKPVAVLREYGRKPDLTAPEPNTWRELLATLDAATDLAGKTVAVQEYGVSNDPLLAALTERGARVLRVPVYRWALPEDLGPLHAAIDTLLAGGAAAVLFTSANQVYSLFEVAAERGEALRAALAHVVVASVGPICTEALAAHGVAVRYEPPHPKMGQLVGGLARALDGLLAEAS
jgi:uroporphyrinogen-III synthase